MMSGVLVFVVAAWVTVTDLFYRRIHNVLIIALFISWCLSVLASIWSVGPYGHLNNIALWHELGLSLLGACGVLFVGFGLFTIGQMGAGDVKLMAVLCLWVGFDNQLVFLIVTALVGGVLALFMPLVSLLELYGAKLITQVSDRFPQLNIPTPLVFSYENVKGLPYGLAISGGACFSLISPIPY